MTQFSAGNVGRTWLRIFVLGACCCTCFGTAQTQTPLADAVTQQGVRAHMAEFQRIASANGGNRAAGTPGFAASARYVRATLEAAGYTVRLQPFSVDTSETLAENASTVGRGAFDLAPVIMDGAANTPEGGLEAPLVRPSDPLGCDPEAFTGVRDRVVLIGRGVCTFGEKVANAAAAGAAAVLIYNQADAAPDEPLYGSLGEPEGQTVPAAGLTQAAGEKLINALNGSSVRVALELRVLEARRPTANVIAEWPETADTPERSVLMLGAHLDSVPEGPGINDNGSGSALVLELARQLAATGDPSGVRFAFWGAEELGLLGSYHYAEALSASELGRLRAYLNFDMVSSPNALPLVYGDPELAGRLKEALGARGVRSATTDLQGSSDHAPFQEAGVPVAGLFTGASGSKSAGQARRYGGAANVPFDGCYHQACDTLAGSTTPVSTRYLEVLADTAADTLQGLRRDLPRQR